MILIASSLGSYSDLAFYEDFNSSDSNILLELTNRARFFVGVSDFIGLIARVKKNQVSARAILNPLADEDDRIGADSLGWGHSASCSGCGSSGDRGSSCCNCRSILVLCKYSRFARSGDDCHNRQGLTSCECVNVALSILLS